MDKILDNKKLGKVGDALKEHISKGSYLSIASAYFTIYAYNELKKELSNIEGMNLLLTEPMFIEDSKVESREFYIEKIINEKKIYGNEFEIKMRNELNQGKIAAECAKWLRKIANIKSIKKSDITTTKLFHIKSKDGLDVAIQGSSDFTTDGLGYSNSPKMCMNMFTNESTTTKDMLNWFNDIWNNKELVQDVKEDLLQQMQEVYKENTPEFIYFITLYNVFNNYLDELMEEKVVKSRTGFKDTLIWNKLYKFQKDGVLGAIDKLEKYNGCIIADSVGLGKTFSALAIIKYYELRNDRVLVLTPKKLRDNWIVYTKNDKRNIFVDDRFGYNVLNHTDLSRYSGMSGDNKLETIKWSNYDLIVIDESHNFRNNSTHKDKVTRYSRLLNDVIKAGVKTKILMLSATPVNNRMNDLKNQVAFITEGNDQAFENEGIISIEQTLRKAQMVFNKWSELPDDKRLVDTFIEMMNMDYFKLLDTITIARSRKHIEKYYDIKEIGKFPERNKPINIYADIDLEGNFPPLKEVNKTIKNLNMSSYSPLKYVLPEKRKEYSKKYDTKVKNGKLVFKQVDREQSLINLMRVNILKRMESSINSFSLTIARFLKEVDNRINKINTISKVIKNQFDDNASFSIADINLDDDEVDEMLIGSKVKVLLQDMDLIKWKQDLLEDRGKLESLLIEAAKVTKNRDAKLAELKKMIDSKQNNPINEGNKKILIFTAFADTAKYLYENIADWAMGNYHIHSALVTGTGRNQTNLKEIKRKDFDAILTSFSPRSKERDKTYSDIVNEIDILIATDCISEGQNLQDCDYLINYDIHWNPVRIIQRFGRIDRLGSCNNAVQLVNFWANMELDEYINLEARVTGKMVLMDISATGEENLTCVDEKKSMNDLEYRKKQLKQLQEEVVDLEEIAGGISITDMTLNDFKMDLMEYMKENRTKLEKAPMGMYAVSTVDDEKLKEQIRPGVIFALKQVNEFARPEENNSLYPHYMVYVYDDGTVKYNYLHTKKILDFYKKLSAGKDEVLKDVVAIFNSETDNGRDMSYYSKQLEDAINNIIGKAEEKGVASLFSKGGTTIQKNLFSGIEDFELISFLIIK